MRTRETTVAVLLVLGVLLMHGSVAVLRTEHPQAAHPVQMAAAEHDHERAATLLVDCDHDHAAHLCAATVVTATPLAPAPLVTVVARAERAASADGILPADAARGPPAWTVHTLDDLCLLRI